MLDAKKFWGGGQNIWYEETNTLTVSFDKLQFIKTRFCHLVFLSDVNICTKIFIQILINKVCIPKFVSKCRRQNLLSTDFVQLHAAFRGYPRGPRTSDCPLQTPADLR